MPSLLVSVDVEEDMPEGRVQAQTTLRNLQGLEGLQAVCERLGVRPTYLCTWPVATRPEGEFLGTWARHGRAEVGSLLHPWVTPPYDANEDRLEAVGPQQLSATSLHAKVGTLTQAVAARIGRPPRAFRAANFGLNGALLQVIERHGYSVDCSVTPRLDTRPRGGVDHRSAPDVPYFPDRQFVDRRGTASVLEIPVSVAHLVGLPDAAARTLAHLPPVLGLTRWLTHAGGLEPHVLRASEPVERLCRLADALVERDVPTVHLYLRSSELFGLMSGGGRAEDEAQKHLEKTERFLAYAMHTLGVIPRTLSEFATSWAGGG
jgi:hypothetical protein